MLIVLIGRGSYHPSPFFVLDEVDAALDNTNVGRIANYVRSRAGPQFQFVGISLKGSFYEKASGLVGVWRDKRVGGSRVLTLDVSLTDITIRISVDIETSLPLSNSLTSTKSRRWNNLIGCQAQPCFSSFGLRRLAFNLRVVIWFPHSLVSVWL